MTKEERKDILDSIHSTVEEKAGQPVRFKVEHLNLAKDWAVLVGSLLGAEGKKMDWSKAQDCDEDLDKMLWVVAQKQNNAWHVKDVDICSPEPPYWYLKTISDHAKSMRASTSPTQGPPKMNAGHINGSIQPKSRIRALHGLFKIVLSPMRCNTKNTYLWPNIRLTRYAPSGAAYLGR